VLGYFEAKGVGASFPSGKEDNFFAAGARSKGFVSVGKESSADIKSNDILLKESLI